MSRFCPHTLICYKYKVGAYILPNRLSAAAAIHGDGDMMVMITVTLDGDKDVEWCSSNRDGDWYVVRRSRSSSIKRRRARELDHIFATLEHNRLTTK